jgi:hypothetical protein
VEFLTNAGPYLISTIGAGFAAWLTSKRTKEAQESTALVDQQTLVNNTYETVLKLIREELTRKDSAHTYEREEWERKEEALNRRVNNLEEQVQNLQTELQDLRNGQGT